MTASKSIQLFSWLICLILLCHIHVFEAEASPNNTLVLMQLSQVKNQPQPHQIFRPVLSGLKAKTRVPLMLPTYIPQEDYPLYITVNAATPTQYELTIGAVENCSGGNYCRYGTISGQKLTPSTPSVAQEYAFLNDPSYKPTERSPEKMGRVVLANGIKGYFIPYVCGANCDDSKVIWEQKGYRYLVGLKRGDKKAVVQMANSAIKHTR
jgi:hypothetical protein